MRMPKLIMMFTQNMCNFLCINYISIELKKNKELVHTHISPFSFPEMKNVTIT